MKIKELLESATAKWVLPHGSDLTADFEEYKKKEDKKWKLRAQNMGFRFPIFNTKEDFENALKGGRQFTLSTNDWDSIQNLSMSTDLDDLKSLVGTYVRPRDVDRIVKGMKEGAELPLPIVLKGKKGRWIMAGNTRLNVARILGIPAKAIELDVSE